MSLAARSEPRKAPSEPAPDPAALLDWYARHRRALPWRALPGEAADPYGVWLSEIMLQQTTVKAVAPYYARFLAQWPDVVSLAAAPLDDVLRAWAGLGYYARVRNLHACAQAVAMRHGGRFPSAEGELRVLPGIGAYTAAAIAAIAFGRDASPVDGNIERVVGRLYAVEEPLPSAKPRIKALAEALTPLGRAGDFAQAMMDLGATICTPNNPACALCPFFDGCLARRRGDQESFPRKMPKAEGRLRRGAAFWVCRPDGAVLVRTRPARGLLGGMTELPGSEWTPQFADADAVPTATALLPAVSAARWLQLPGTVTHVFTHFPLELTVWAATLSARSAAPAGMRWVAAAKLDDEALPSLMRKVVAHARRHTEAHSGQS